MSRIARVAVAMAPFVGCYLLYNTLVTGHPLITGRQFLYPTSLFGFGADAAHGPSYGSVGHTPVKGLLNVLLQFGTLSTGLFGWSLVSLVPAAVGFLAGRRGIWEWVFILIVGATASVLFFSWYSAVEHGPRHYLDAWPGLILLSAVGLRTGYRWLRQRTGMVGANWLSITVGGLFLITAARYMPVRFNDLRGPWLGVDPEIRSVVAQQVESPALVFMSFPEDPADYFCSGFVHNDPFLTAPILYARDRDADLNEECLNRFPGRNGYLLRYDPVSRNTTVHVLRSHADAPHATIRHDGSIDTVAPEEMAADQ